MISAVIFLRPLEKSVHIEVSSYLTDPTSHEILEHNFLCDAFVILNRNSLHLDVLLTISLEIKLS
jgi:hypothetical protein